MTSPARVGRGLDEVRGLGWSFGVWVGVKAMAGSACGDRGGDGSIEVYEGFSSGGVEGGDDGGARKQVSVGEVGPGGDAERATGILGLEGI